MLRNLVQFVGPNYSLQIGGVKLLGFDAINGRKVILSLIFFLILYSLLRHYGPLHKR